MCPLHPESVKNEIVDLFTYSFWGTCMCVILLNNGMLSSLLWEYPSSNHIFDCSAVCSSQLSILLVIRGVPSLIIAQTQVSAPLNSRPVDG